MRSYNYSAAKIYAFAGSCKLFCVFLIGKGKGYKIITYICRKNKHTNCKMPTIFFYLGLRFFFYSNEHKPPHIHVKSASGMAKFNLLDGSLMDAPTMKSGDLKKAIEILEEKREEFLKEWFNVHGE